MLYLRLYIYDALILTLFKIVKYKMFQILSTYMQEQTKNEGKTNTLFVFATSIVPKMEKKGPSPYNGRK